MADGTPVGARMKDQLENRLHFAVCAGRMTLAQARAEIGVHWVHCWLRLPMSASASTGGAGAAGAYGVAAPPAATAAGSEPPRP